MATMGLDIGGAETHIVELAKELKRLGNDVIIASNGGVYVEECERAGVRHYAVPMHRRSILPMVKSFFGLRRVIKKERPDVVHAHARIPAFICGLIRKTLNFPFVTTAHWVFNAEGALRILTNWGDRTIAVSDDIRDYLIENYGIAREHIFLTINGIDTERFSEKTSGETVRDKLGIEADAPVLAHVSRMDEDRALAARHLVEIAPRLAVKIPGVVLLIAGGGNVFDELKAKAEKVNAALGRKCVIMTGARTDINEIVAAGDVFVGVSRAALEAMASAKPVILAGNEGYLGIFTEDKLQEGIDGNFCCRGCGMIASETLFSDIVSCMEMSAEQKRGLGAYGREVVLKYYSVGRMAGDAMSAYKSAMPPKRFVLSGYYGFGNAGDEAILDSVCRTIRARDEKSEITVLSKNPEYTRETYGCGAVYRFNPASVLGALRNCDIVVSGGGSLLQDATSTRSLMYYLSIIHFAARYGKKVMLYANGIGPVSKPKNRERVKKEVETASLVTLRDPDSLRELRAMGVSRDDLVVTADPVFLLDAGDEAQSVEILRSAFVPDGSFICVSIRKCAGAPELPERLAEACDAVFEKYGHNIVFLAMHPGVDAEASRAVMEKMKHKAYLVPDGYNAHELMAIISKSEAVISMRLHSLIFAARVAVPSVGIVYDPKVEAYLALLDQPSAGRADSFDPAAAVSALDGIFENYKTVCADLSKKRDELVVAAAQNEKLLAELACL